jgi:hypothetical protein
MVQNLTSPGGLTKLQPGLVEITRLCSREQNNTKKKLKCGCSAQPISKTECRTKFRYDARESPVLKKTLKSNIHKPVT